MILKRTNCCYYNNSISTQITKPRLNIEEFFSPALQAGNPGTYPYTLSVRYEDDYGVQTRNETLQMTVNDGDSTGLVVAVLLVLIIGGGGYWFFVLRKKGSSDA